MVEGGTRFSVTLTPWALQGLGAKAWVLRKRGLARGQGWSTPGQAGLALLGATIPTHSSCIREGQPHPAEFPTTRWVDDPNSTPGLGTRGVSRLGLHSLSKRTAPLQAAEGQPRLLTVGLTADHVRGQSSSLWPRASCPYTSQGTRGRIHGTCLPGWPSGLG